MSRNTQQATNGLFAARLTALMDENNETQKALAEALGTKQQTISYYRNALSLPDIERLIKIAEHYNVTTDYLLGLADMAAPSVEVQAISDYTGLSAKAIVFLKKTAEEKKEITEALKKNGCSEKVENLLLSTNIDLFLSDENSEIFFDILSGIALKVDNSVMLCKMIIDRLQKGLDFKNPDDMKWCANASSRLGIEGQNLHFLYFELTEQSKKVADSLYSVWEIENKMKNLNKELSEMLEMYKEYKNNALNNEENN